MLLRNDLEEKRIKNAIIIHGPGRSGTTLLSNLLSLHPDLSWVSGYVNRFPEWPSLAVLNRIQRILVLEHFSRGRRRWPRPAEAYGFWRHYFPGFEDPSAHIDSHELDNSVMKCVQCVEKIVAAGGGKRFVTKLTGLSRARYLDLVFEEPMVVWIDRDPRAVIASYHKQRWGYKHNPDGFAAKSTSDLLREFTERYVTNLRSSCELERYDLRRVRYEDLVEDPQTFFVDLLAWLGLPALSSFLQTVNSWEIQKRANETWRANFSPGERAELEKLVTSRLEFLGLG